MLFFLHIFISRQRELVEGISFFGGDTTPKRRLRVPRRNLMLVYVALQPELHQSGSSQRVYALIIPDVNNDWGEVVVDKSPLAGWGVFPQNSALLDWSDVSTPVLLPYLGAETVVHDVHLQKCLLIVLHGDFELVTVQDVCRMNRSSGALYRDGLCAVPLPNARGGEMRERLSPETQLLQVAHPGATNSFKGGVQSVDAGNHEVCYLIARDVQIALNLSNSRSKSGDYLWRLLCAHGKHHHSDRHLATHVSVLTRKEEGHVLINAHPAFKDKLSLTGMVNEPTFNERPTLKMRQAYCRLLFNDDPMMRESGLRQPAGAVAAWREHVLPPVGMSPDSPLSERMVLYESMRKKYDLGVELSVDYGKSYRRNYNSHTHRGQLPLYRIPPDQFHPETLEQGRFPEVPGWFNPALQPRERPAFRWGARGAIVVCDDVEEVVQRRKYALGLSTIPRSPTPTKMTTPTKTSKASRASLDRGSYDKGSPDPVSTEARLKTKARFARATLGESNGAITAVFSQKKKTRRA